jgi:hypothetical protein
MLRFVGLGLTILFTLNAATTTQEPFAKFRKVEAYEVRPGILMIPRYTAANEICEIGLEKLLYSPSLIRLNPELSREEILQTLDELVPVNERGKPPKDSEDRITQMGQIPTETTTTEYENVLIRIYGVPFRSKNKNESTMNDVVATVTWKHRICR